MKVIKKINNNVALCMDSNDRELIAFGKGIGFPSMPYEINDLTKIDKTFYSVKQSYLLLLNEIPEKILRISSEILDYCRRILPYEINETLCFTIADHLNFAISQAKQHIYLQTGLTAEVSSYHKEEYEIGLECIRRINKEFDIILFNDEAANIAMHIIENENRKKSDTSETYTQDIIDEIIKIVESHFKTKIDRTSFNCSRFVTHIQYLLLRRKNKVSIVSDNSKLFEVMKSQYCQTYKCAIIISAYINDKLDWKISDEEILYLMLHINRMCYREDCNQ